ncbi:hypothetical protein ACHAPI_009419 [Fusarium lateritium]
MADITVRLRRLGPTIERLISIAGAPGVSIGVLIKDKPAYYDNYGYRSVEQKLPITEDTIFLLCPPTKAFTAAALGLLIDEYKLSWNSLVKDALLSFHSTDPFLHSHTTITDIPSHRTGMGWGDNLIPGTDGNVLLKSEDAMKHINNRPHIGSFRAQFGYNNLHYKLAGQIIEHDAEGVAVCYNALDDASIAPINCPRMGNDWYGAVSGGARLSVKDLVKLYGSYVNSFNNEFKGDTSFSEELTFK